MELMPSEVRDVVLSDHAALRARITLIKRALREAEGQGNEAPLRSLLPDLFAHLRSHLALEDRLLLPTLRSIDAWGPQREAAMVELHAQQRRWISDMSERMAGAATALELVKQTKEIIDELERDMESEEKDALNEQLLRDDPISVEFGG